MCRSNDAVKDPRLRRIAWACGATACVYPAPSLERLFCEFRCVVLRRRSPDRRSCRSSTWWSSSILLRGTSYACDPHHFLDAPQRAHHLGQMHAVGDLYGEQVG